MYIILHKNKYITRMLQSCNQYTYMYIILHTYKYITRKLGSCNQYTYNMISSNTHTLMIYVLEFPSHKLKCEIKRM